MLYKIVIWGPAKNNLKTIQDLQEILGMTFASLPELWKHPAGTYESIFETFLSDLKIGSINENESFFLFINSSDFIDSQSTNLTTCFKLDSKGSNLQTNQTELVP